MSVWMTCPTCSSRLICLKSSVMRASVPGSIRPALLAAGHRCGCATGGAQMATGATVHASPHSTSARHHRPQSRVMCWSPTVQEVPVPAAAQLRPPPLRREIDVVEPEAVGVALGPLEVIEQRPGEISPDRDAARDRLTQCRHVTDEVVAALDIVHGPVGVDEIVVARAVLGDIELAGTIVALHTLEQRHHTGRRDLPAEIGDLAY